MKIAIIGAAGKAGSRILAEALERGHEVTAIVRDAAKVTDSRAAVLEKDVFQLKTNDLNSFDVVVNAFGAPLGEAHLHMEAGNVLIEALKDAPFTKLFVVGGAGSLFVDPEKTTRVWQTFPKEFEIFLPTAQNQLKNLEILQQTNGITWTFLSPSAHFALGKRTGFYLKGKDHLLVNSQGESYVSYEDYAVAVLDELENPQHVNERFTVASEA